MTIENENKQGISILEQLIESNKNTLERMEILEKGMIRIWRRMKDHEANHDNTGGSKAQGKTEKFRSKRKRRKGKGRIIHSKQNDTRSGVHKSTVGKGSSPKT